MNYLPPFFERKSPWIQLLYLVLFVVFGLILQGVIVAALFIMIKDQLLLYRISQFISTFFIFMAPALLFSYCANKNWFSYGKAHVVAPPPLVGYVLIGSLLLLPIVACLGYWNEQISFPAQWAALEQLMKDMEAEMQKMLELFTRPASIPLLIFNIGLLALTPALFEEFFFRGTLQPLLSKIIKNKHLAIILTAFIFSAIHFQFYGFIPRFLLGIYLGYLLVWSGSLWLPIIAHFMHNAISVIIDYGMQRHGIVTDSIQLENITYFYPFVSICAIGIGVVVYKLFKNRVIETKE